MEHALSPRTLRLALASLALVALHAASAWLASSQHFAAAPAVMSVGITLDLTVTAAAIVYLLAVRPGHLRWPALVAVAVAGMAVAGWILPEEHRGALQITAAAWAVVELALAVYVLTRLRAIARAVRRHRSQGLRLPHSLELGLTGVLGRPRISAFLAQELGVACLAFAGWFRRPVASAWRDRDEATWGAIVLALLIVLLGETVAAHVLLARGSPLAAWIVTGLHAYTLLWLLGDYQCLRHLRPRLTADALEVELGVRARVRIELDRIEAVEVLPEDEPPPARAGDCAAGSDRLDLNLLWSPNLLVTLREPVVTTRLFGRTRAARTLGFAVEDPRKARALLLRQGG